MNTKFAVAIGALSFSSGLLQASPWDRCPPPPPPQVSIEYRIEQPRYRDDRRDEYERCEPQPRYSFWDRAEVKAQVRLQKLGYYCGPIDGCFGQGSRKALMHFQLDRDLPVSGRLDHCTMGALRIY